MRGRNRDSRPDGWILIYKNREAYYLVALENKLYNLDLKQLNNHLKKSLYVNEDHFEKQTIFCKYQNINDLFARYDGNYMCNQFIEYMVILGYFDLQPSFEEAFSADKDLVQRFALKFFGESFLHYIHVGEIDHRNWKTIRCKVDYPYLREINLSFEKEGISLHLNFGSTQSSGKAMLSKLDDFDFKENNNLSIYPTFHLLYQRGRNIPASYITRPLVPLNNFFLYLKENSRYLRLSTPQEAVEFYKKLYEDKMIDESQFKEIDGFLKDKKNKVTFVPELTFQYHFSYDEVLAYGELPFKNKLKECSTEALKSTKLI